MKRGTFVVTKNNELVEIMTEVSRDEARGKYPALNYHIQSRTELSKEDFQMWCEQEAIENEVVDAHCMICGKLIGKMKQKNIINAHCGCLIQNMAKPSSI